jgi:magnesium-transporting ATPase (P-type)
MPKTANVLINGEIIEKNIEEITYNDIIIVKPGEKVPLDGIIVEGRCYVDQSAITGESKKDIHESDLDYLEKSYNNSLYIADKYDWKKINCVENQSLRSIDSIHEEIYKLVTDTIKSIER